MSNEIIDKVLSRVSHKCVVMKSVEEIMSPAAKTLESSVSVSEAAKLMFAQDLGSVGDKRGNSCGNCYRT